MNMRSRASLTWPGSRVVCVMRVRLSPASAPY